MQKFIYALALLILAFGGLAGQTLSRESILIETRYGNIKLRFYEETPIHKTNFLKLVNDHFFDSLLFHRVISNFMIQGGDPLNRTAMPGDSLGHGDLGYTLPAEIRPGLIHKKGALCAAREGDAINPEFRSSASQFYIVEGKTRSPEDLKKYEARINKAHYDHCARAFMETAAGTRLKQNMDRLAAENKTDSAGLVERDLQGLIREEYLKTPEYVFSSRQREIYSTLGGTPHLDNTYTVFGEVTEGIDVIDQIAVVKTDQRNRPLEDIRMKITVVKE